MNLSEKQGKKLSKLIDKYEQLSLTIGKLVIHGTAVLLLCLLLLGGMNIIEPLVGEVLALITLTGGISILFGFIVQHMEDNDNYFD